MNEEQVRQHCQSHLPAHMIPSKFMIIEKLPLNANGKIDRKRLPSPDLSSLSLPLLIESHSPCNQLEERVHDIWCQVLGRDGQQISTMANFFSTGGHSLLFIELYHRYQSAFHFDTRELSIAPLLQQPTIMQHAQLLQQITTNDMKSTQWHTLHITKGRICSCLFVITYKMLEYETFRCCIVCSRAYFS
jgi:aryl carrier-like protein